MLLLVFREQGLHRTLLFNDFFTVIFPNLCKIRFVHLALDIILIEVSGDLNLSRVNLFPLIQIYIFFLNLHGLILGVDEVICSSDIGHVHGALIKFEKVGLIRDLHNLSFALFN